MTNNSNKGHQQGDQNKVGKKRTILKATLIGFAVGVMFIVSAKMVNMVIT